MNFSAWLRIPPGWKACYLLVLPIIISQILQRLYPVIDSRYISLLGKEALLLHSVQYNFIIFGQFMGAATAISCLVFWKRQECIKKQGSIFLKHILLVGVSMAVLALILAVFSSWINIEYKVDSAYLKVGSIYLCIGLCNMVLQALYGSLDGMLLASGQQKKSMMISFVMLFVNVLADAYAIHFLFSGIQDPGSIYNPILFIGLSTTVFLIMGCLTATYFVVKNAQGWEEIHFREIMPVWKSELGVYVIRGVTPFIYAFQLSLITVTSGLLVTYQLALQLSYIFCLPLLASMQLAVRNASEEFTSNSYNKNTVPRWWNELLYTGLLPTVALLMLGLFFPCFLLLKVYHYVLPPAHLPFISIYFLACLVGQFANILTVPLRSRKKNYLVMRNFFFSELIVMLGGTEVLILIHQATPFNAGIAVLLFVIMQLLLNLWGVLLLREKPGTKLIYEEPLSQDA